ncbi:MAG: ribosomal protein L7/L12 [Myxococcota bacterium]
MLLLLGLSVLVLVAVALTVLLVSRRRGVEVVSLTPPPPGQPAADASPEQLLRAGQKIAAIKRYRELTGVGLREAKEAIDALERGEPPQSLPPKAAVLRQVSDSEIEAQIRTGHLLDAIKLYREKNGVGLKEAKDAVEAWRHRMRAS